MDNNDKAIVPRRRALKPDRIIGLGRTYTVDFHGLSIGADFEYCVIYDLETGELVYVYPPTELTPTKM